MLCAGDEFGNSQRGNNNAYCQDNTTAWLDWCMADSDDADGDIDFVASLIALRLGDPLLRHARWFSGEGALPDAQPDIAWLDTDGLHGYLLARPVAGPGDSRKAAALYAELLGQAVGADFWATGLRKQVFLGSDAFVEGALAALPARQRQMREVPRTERSRPQSLDQLMQDGLTRNEALRTAHVDGGFTMTQLAAELGLSVSRVSRLIASFEAGQAKGKT
jgi:hypothetical protein